LSDTALALSTSPDGGPYLINIPSTFSVEKLKTMKDLLMKQKGDLPVEVYLEASDKKILLPFKIDLSEDLKSEISNLLAS
jgi:hypothetical protein